MKKILLCILFAHISTLGFSQVPSYVPSNGLVGWWPFNGNADDESSNGNNGANNGATLSTDRNGNVNSAYSFDGVDDVISIADNIQLRLSQGDFTISIWYKTFSYGLPNRNFIIKTDGPGTTNKWIICKTSVINGGPYVSLHTNGSLGSYWANASVNEDILWHHLIVLKQGSLFKFYQDGILLSTNSTLQMQSSNADIRIGGDEISGGGHWHHGALDDIGIWNRALTDCEIQNLYTSTNPSNTTTATACGSYVWNGQTYSASGVYTDISNCVTESLNLTINQSTSSSISQTALDSYTWPVNNQTYTTTGAYTAVIPNAAGCDSTITLNLTMSFTGINDLSASKLSIYPNPTNGDFTITGLELLGTVSSLTLTDMNGKVVKVLDTKATKFTMASIKPGVYFLNIRAGNKQEVLKIVKE